MKTEMLTKKEEIIAEINTAKSIFIINLLVMMAFIFLYIIIEDILFIGLSFIVGVMAIIFHVDERYWCLVLRSKK